MIGGVSVLPVMENVKRGGVTLVVLSTLLVVVSFTRKGLIEARITNVGSIN